MSSFGGFSRTVISSCCTAISIGRTTVTGPDIFDIFRLDANGKIVETHSARTANRNTMF